MAKKIDPNIVYGLAGIFAVSNMGQNLPDLSEVKHWRKATPRDVPTANGAACFFAGAYMETNEHERMFEAEVKMWAADIRKRGVDALLAVNADIKKLWEAAAPENANA